MRGNCSECRVLVTSKLIHLKTCMLSSINCFSSGRKHVGFGCGKTYAFKRALECSTLVGNDRISFKTLRNQRLSLHTAQDYPKSLLVRGRNQSLNVLVTKCYPN